MNNERGFVALISVIIISAILLVIVTGGALTSIYSRSNILDSELKERSEAAADGCADQALLQLAENGSIAITNYTFNSVDKCIMKSIDTTTFEVQAISSNEAVTNLKVVYDPNDLSVVSWEEIPNY